MIKNLINLRRYIKSHPLTRDNPFGAYGRFLRWQIGSRLLRMPVVMPLVGKSRLLVKKGLHGATGNFYLGLFEFEEMAFVLHFLRQEDFFLDVGANIGVYTVLASSVCGSRTASIEPVAETADILRDNIHLNHLDDKVSVHIMGLAAKKGRVYFTNDCDTTNHVISDNEVVGDGSSEVETTTMDELCADQVPVLVKIDVEGYENEVITGADRTLDNPGLKAIIIELNGSGNRYGFDENKIHQTLKAKGFDCYLYDPFLRQLRPVPSYGNHNTIYVRDLNYVQDRLKTATKFSVLGQEI